MRHLSIKVLALTMFYAGNMSHCNASQKPHVATLQPDSVYSISLPEEYSSLRIDVIGAMHTKGFTIGDGKHHWGITMLDGDHQPRLKVTLIAGTDNLDTSFSQAYMRVTVDSISQSGTTHNIFSQKYYSELKLTNGSNGIRTEIADGVCRIQVGTETPVTLGTFPWPTPLSEANIGGNCAVDMNFIETDFTLPTPPLPLSGWSIDEVSNYIPTAQGICGIWHFMDRDTDARFADPGGAYTLAILPHKHSTSCPCAKSSSTIPVFDIIYLDGAAIYPDRWQPGMIKGYLYVTPFENHYRLEWYDASKQLINKEITADYTAPAILSLHFPLLKSHLRFSRY